MQVQVTITVYAESDDTENYQLVEDTIEILETMLPYMWNNVVVTASYRD